MQTQIQAPKRPAMVRPRTLERFDVETVRVEGERRIALVIQAHPQFAALEAARIPSDPKEIRRVLLASSLRLTDTMAPVASRTARLAQQVLGVTGELEIYQRNGGENAGIHLIEAPILLEIQGRLLPLLDDAALLAVFGHELGHYLAHGSWSALGRAHGLKGAIGHPSVDDRLARQLLALSMLGELTADRVGLLACQDLDAMLRLEMVTLTGLSGDALTWDTDAYLAQCKDLMESVLAAHGSVYGSTHPEHNLRAYALWLFSETRTYRDLTGKGPGTRTLAEVDELLWKFIADDEDQRFEPGYHMLDEPPRELHECALAATVIVAFADGELAEEEKEAIERMFAALVGDWESYLDQDIAIARFLGSAPVLAAAGGDLLRALFNLLVHVMGADGIVDEREVSAILAIGGALGCEAEYRRMLTASLFALRVTVDVEQTAPIDLPLPARQDEVSDAFDAFQRGVERRGQSVITMRRLLRLLGSDRRDDALVERIERALEQRDIEVDGELATVDLDTRIQLTAPSAYVEEIEPPPDASGGDARSGLVVALTRMRDQLVSGDGRSPSVRLRTPRKGRSFDLFGLEKLSVGLAERVLAQFRAGKSVRLVSAAEAGTHTAGRSIGADLLALDREHHARLEETGGHDLYVGYPLLTGNVTSGDKRSGLYLVRGPLVLHPVDLEREGQGARGFKLRPRKDEPPIVNQSLLRLIFNKKGFAYPDELSDELDALAGDPAAGIEAVLAKLAEVGLSATRKAGALSAFGDRNEELELRGEHLEVEECALIGIFPQSSSDLLQDYDGLLTELAKPRVDVASLLGAAQALLPRALRRGTTRDDARDMQEPPPHPPVIFADPSQRKVIAECRRNGVTVVDGPPGTGKSQVIVNLVTDALRRGERVAVVCEKRAALDVVSQRLQGLGLRHLLALVHDVKEDRKGLYEQIAGRLEEDLGHEFDAKEASRIEREHARCTAGLESRAQLLEHRPDGAGLTVGELCALASGLDGCDVPASPELARIGLAQVRELHEIITALHPLTPVWRPDSQWRGPTSTPRRSFVGWSDTQLDGLAAAVEQAAEDAQAHERLAEACPGGAAAVEAARPALAEVQRSREARRDAVDQQLFSRVLGTAVEAPDRLRAADEARATWEETSTALVRWQRPVEMQATPELVRSLSVMQRWAGNLLRSFVWGWWVARKAVKQALVESWPERAADPLDRTFLSEIADRVAASGAWKRVAASLEQLQMRELLPATADRAGTFVARVAELASGASRLAAVRAPLDAVHAWLPAGDDVRRFEQWDRAVDDRLALIAARDRARASAARVAEIFPWMGELPSAQDLRGLLQDLRRDGRRLVESDGLRARAEGIARSMPFLLDTMAVRLADGGPDRWRAALTRAWAQSWLATVENERPNFATLGTSAEDREVERLGASLEKLEQEVRENEVERVLAAADDIELLKTRAAAKHKRRTEEQKAKEQILKETRKKRRVMPLRSFVRRYAEHGLLDVVPVWLLSPETMAILFPREPLFDLVVFDEASQCTVESGFPVLLRAKRVVIAGDEKQMPPSTYFRLGSSSDEDDEPPDEEQREVKDTLAAESLLTLARTRVPHAGLSWHYRCRDEALIAFSNHAMYHGTLLTIPATTGPAAQSAIKWIPVENGEYDKGENRPEAEKVVDVLHELLERTPRPSVGIVTFNLKQKKAVLDAIDVRKSNDRIFAELHDEADSHESVDERPFVKNLDQVQGDERDVIVFSLGHAPVPRTRRGQPTGELYIAARFGPLGQRGGERRLNVAISRAKQECYLVASFEPSQMMVASTRNEGPKLLRQFLDFAHHMAHGRHAQAQSVLDRVREARLSPNHRQRKLPVEGYTPLVTQIALALEKEGVPFELDVGASEMRVPLAVLAPDDPTRFVLAILTDEGTQSLSAFERHVHRPAVLRLRDWKVLHVTAASWMRRRDEVLEKIFELVPGARGALSNDVWKQHRAAARKAEARPAAAKTTPRSRPEPPVALVGGVAEDGVPYERSEQPASSASQGPAWAAAIGDARFVKALLHLEKHGSLNETELVNIVGGARRARRFANELDGWADTLPFVIEVTTAGNTKTYRNRGAK